MKWPPSKPGRDREEDVLLSGVIPVDSCVRDVGERDAAEGAIGARAVRSETNLSFNVDEIDELIGVAVDPYIAVRDAYIQYREKRVKE